METKEGEMKKLTNEELKKWVKRWYETWREHSALCESEEKYMKGGLQQILTLICQKRHIDTTRS